MQDQIVFLDGIGKCLRDIGCENGRCAAGENDLRLKALFSNSATRMLEKTQMRFDNPRADGIDRI